MGNCEKYRKMRFCETKNVELFVIFGRQFFKTNKKASAYCAVPKIIEKGRVVNYQQNWKNRGYDTAVIAAPITVAIKNIMQSL